MAAPSKHPMGALNSVKSVPSKGHGVSISELPAAYPPDVTQPKKHAFTDQQIAAGLLSELSIYGTVNAMAQSGWTVDRIVASLLSYETHANIVSALSNAEVCD